MFNMKELVITILEEHCNVIDYGYKNNFFVVLTIEGEKRGASVRVDDCKDPGCYTIIGLNTDNDRQFNLFEPEGLEKFSKHLIETVSKNTVAGFIIPENVSN